MVVGDELQSIYGFRHADLDVFRERRRAIEASAGGEVIPLSGNFRSRPELIGAVNAIGERLLDGYTPLRVGAPPASPQPRRRGAGGGDAAHRPRGLGRGRDRARPGNRRPHAGQPAGRGPLPRLAAARAGRPGRRARRDGRAAARLHPPRRPRGLAGESRPAPLRRRRPRLLVPAAGRRRLRAAGDDRQPARRPGAAGNARLTRLRSGARHALAAARRGGQGPPHLADRGAGGGTGRGRARRPRATRADPRGGAARCCAASPRRSPRCAGAPPRSRSPA